MGGRTHQVGKALQNLDSLPVVLSLSFHGHLPAVKMSEENSVSDVDPDDLAEMMKGIDDLDDDLFGKKKPKSQPPKEAPPQKSVLKSSQQELGQLGSGGRKVQFSAKTESDWDNAAAADDDITKEKEKESVTNQNEPFKDPPVKDIPRKKVEIDFGDDDILGGLDSNTNKSKPKASSGLLDDIFGKTGDKGKKSSFLDDIISGGGGGAGKETAKESFSKSEFTLDAKYKVGKDKGGFDLGQSEQSEQPRRRRGNPTVGGKKASESELLSSAPSTKPPPETANPFPWMTEKSTVPNPEVKNSNQNETSRLNESIKPSFVGGPNQKEPSSLPPATLSTTIQFTPTLPHPTQPQPNLLPTSQASLEEYSKVGLEQQKVFEEELESYKVATAQRKAEHASAIERQRQELAARMQELQAKQNQVHFRPLSVPFKCFLLCASLSSW